MRLRTFATTTVLTGVLTLAGAAGAVAAEPGPTTGVAVDSPGVVSGNVVQIPVEVDANVCGNTINVVGLLNPAAGNTCVNQ
ncbi:chaplin [Streptomyces sp. PBH53]|uniref:chaplin n=1 Tax=Streptomyces sp. PBH53 TaxID=1577075 RepID=UPI0006554DD3|nr:chaplin [Streptomyces sp. PBH53]AKN71587.1 chaplin [Streptomyces sp. PBH53]